MNISIFIIHEYIIVVVNINLVCVLIYIVITY